MQMLLDILGTHRQAGLSDNFGIHAVPTSLSFRGGSGDRVVAHAHTISELQASLIAIGATGAWCWMPLDLLARLSEAV